MTIVRFKNPGFALPAFNKSLGDVFFQTPSLYSGQWKTPVNILEIETAFVLELVIPGFEKGDFKVDVENGLLTVAAERKEGQAAEGVKQLCKEFIPSSFKRSFTLDETVDTEGVTAQYNNGVLTLNLPKKAPVKPAVKQIEIQ